MANEDFLSELGQGDTDPFAALDTTTPSDSAPENVGEKVTPEVGGEGTGEAPNTPSDEDNGHFHNHPRWIKQQQEIERLRAEAEENAAFREYYYATEQERQQAYNQQPEIVEIPRWFADTHGEDPVLWSEYLEYEAQKEEQWRQNWENSILQKEQEELQAQQYAAAWGAKWREDNMTEIEINEGRRLSDQEKREFFKFTLENPISNSEGQIDFQKCYAFFKREKALVAAEDPQAAAARRTVADTATRSSNTAGPGKKDYMTPKDLRGKSWNQL